MDEAKIEMQNWWVKELQPEQRAAWLDYVEDGGPLPDQLRGTIPAHRRTPGREGAWLFLSFGGYVGPTGVSGGESLTLELEAFLNEKKKESL